MPPVSLQPGLHRRRHDRLGQEDLVAGVAPVACVVAGVPVLERGAGVAGAVLLSDLHQADRVSQRRHLRGPHSARSLGGLYGTGSDERDHRKRQRAEAPQKILEHPSVLPVTPPPADAQPAVPHPHGRTYSPQKRFTGGLRRPSNVQVASTCRTTHRNLRCWRVATAPVRACVWWLGLGTRGGLSGSQSGVQRCGRLELQSGCGRRVAFDVQVEALGKGSQDECCLYQREPCAEAGALAASEREPGAGRGGLFGAGVPALGAEGCGVREPAGSLWVTHWLHQSVVPAGIGLPCRVAPFCASRGGIIDPGGNSRRDSLMIC